MDQKTATPSPTRTENQPVHFDVRTYVIIMHVSQFVGLVIPFGSIIAPLIMWAMKRSDSEQVETHGKEIMNFQISFALWTVVAFVLIFLLVGILLLPIVLIGELVCVVIGIIKASNGELYQYPLTIRFIK